MEVNGKTYPMWGKFVEKQNEWINGILEDEGDYIDRRMGLTKQSTKITGIELKPNGETSAFFTICGKDFNCGSDVEVLGIGKGEEGWITFYGYGGHTFRIKQPAKQE